MFQAVLKPVAAAVLLFLCGCGRKVEEAKPSPAQALPPPIPASDFPAPGDTLLPLDSIAKEPPRDTLPLRQPVSRRRPAVQPAPVVVAPPPSPVAQQPPKLDTVPVKGVVPVKMLPAFAVTLTAPQDTLEPGTQVDFNLGVEGDTAGLQTAIDVDGDGKLEAVGKKAGRHAVVFSRGGLFLCVGKARNAHGQTAQALVSVRINARPKVEWKAKQVRANMAEAVSFRLRASDADDSLVYAQVRSEGGWVWDTVTPPGARILPGRKLGLYRTHVFDTVGRFWVVASVMASDGRSGTDSTQVEIFNAPPEVLPDSVIQAKVGEPVSWTGRARDPDGSMLKWEWDVDGDGKFEIVFDKEQPVRYTFSREGEFKLTLRATNAEGLTATGVRKAKVRRK